MLQWLILLAFLVGLYRWWMPRAAAKAFAKLHRDPQHLIVDEEIVDSGSEVSRMQLRWDAIRRAVETPEFFLLFFTGQVAVYVPKRAMGSTSEIIEFRDVLRARLGDRARLSQA